MAQFISDITFPQHINLFSLAIQILGHSRRQSKFCIHFNKLDCNFFWFLQPPRSRSARAAWPQPPPGPSFALPKEILAAEEQIALGR